MGRPTTFGLIGLGLLVAYVWLFVAAVFPLDDGPQPSESLLARWTLLGNFLSRESAVVPSLIIVSGLLGAYARLVYEFLSPPYPSNPDEKTDFSSDFPVYTLLRLAFGAVVGFMAGLVVPISIRSNPSAGLQDFNPAGLSIISSYAAFFGLASSSLLFRRIADAFAAQGQAISPREFAREYQKLVEPERLINFNGYFFVDIKDASGFTIVRPSDNGRTSSSFFADVGISETKPERGTLQHIVIDQGVDASEAEREPIFQIQALSDDLDRRADAELTLVRGRAQATIRLDLAKDARNSNNVNINFIINQSGRNIGVLKVPLFEAGLDATLSQAGDAVAQ